MSKVVPLKDRAQRVSISLPPHTLEMLDRNVERCYSWALESGFDFKQPLNRSLFLKILIDAAEKETPEKILTR